MQFKIPQFIEHETKIIGPLTFKQFLYLGTAGVICFILYFVLPIWLFLIVFILLMGGGFVLAFSKVSGKSLPLVLVNLLKFSSGSKIYIWQKKEQAIKVQKEKTETSLPEEKKGLPLKIAEKSLLKKLHTQIETKTK